MRSEGWATSPLLSSFMLMWLFISSFSFYIYLCLCFLLLTFLRMPKLTSPLSKPQTFLQGIQLRRQASQAEPVFPTIAKRKEGRKEKKFPAPCLLPSCTYAFCLHCAVSLPTCLRLHVDLDRTDYLFYLIFLGICCPLGHLQERRTSLLYTHCTSCSHMGHVSGLWGTQEDSGFGLEEEGGDTTMPHLLISATAPSTPITLTCGNLSSFCTMAASQHENIPSQQQHGISGGGHSTQHLISNWKASVSYKKLGGQGRQGRKDKKRIS